MDFALSDTPCTEELEIGSELTMAKRRKTTAGRPTLRILQGGMSDLRRAYEMYRASGSSTPDVSVITVLSAEDEAYAAEVAERARRRA